jgi:hypothetical protein
MLSVSHYELLQYQLDEFLSNVLCVCAGSGGKQSGFECATWMCRDADVCPYSGFCDRTCNYCLRSDGYPCTPLGPMEGYFAQRAQTGECLDSLLDGVCLTQAQEIFQA